MNPSGVATVGPSGQWGRVAKVLALRLDSIGDVLMTTPALAAIREALPQAHLTLLTSSRAAVLQGHLAGVDELIACDAPWVQAAPLAGLDEAELGQAALGQAELNLAATLRAQRFDAAIIFTVCTQSALPAALLCRLAGIGLRLAHSRENPYGLLSDWVRDSDVVAPGMRHEVRRQLDLVHAVGLVGSNEQLRFDWGVADQHALRERLAQAGGDPDRPYFVVHPGASAPSRRYPAALFGQAAQSLAAMTGLQAIFAGSAQELPRVERARAAMREPSVSLAGQLSFGALGALLAGARVTLCNNSAAAHLAAAVRSPAVVLYALTNPQHTPWQASARLLSRDTPCRNCLQSVCPQLQHPCLAVDPDAVVRAALELIAQGARIRLRRAVQHSTATQVLQR